MRVKLTRKLADHLDGIDLSEYRAGDVLDLSQGDAELLIAERWAIPAKADTDQAAETRQRSAALEPERCNDAPSHQIRLVARSNQTETSVAKTALADKVASRAVRPQRNKR